MSQTTENTEAEEPVDDVVDSSESEQSANDDLVEDAESSGEEPNRFLYTVTLSSARLYLTLSTDMAARLMYLATFSIAFRSAPLIRPRACTLNPEW